MTAPAPDRVPLEALLVHREWVRALARRLVSDPNRADDVEQETWRMALERPPQHAGALRAWFAAVARNAARAIGRSETRRERREAAQASPPGAPRPSDVVAEAELHQRLAAAVLALDEPYRSTVLRRWFEGKEPAQIAAEEGVPVATVRTRMKRGVAMLRARMDVEIGDDREAWCLLLVGTRESPPAAAESTASASGARSGDAAGRIVRTAGEAAMGWGVRAVVAAGMLLIAGVAVVVALRSGPSESAPSTGDASVPTDRSSRSAPVGGRDGRLVTSSRPGGTVRPATDDSSPARNGALRGTVVRADGSVVAGARVEIVSFPWRRITEMNWRAFTETVVESGTASAPDGTFSLSVRDPAPRRVRVTADGCAARTAGPFVAGDPIRIVVGPGVTLRAEVRDEAGAPVVGARLLVMDDEARGEGLVREAATDATGACAFDGLPGGGRATILPSAAVGAFKEVRVELPATGESTVRIVSPAGRTVRGRVVDAVTRAPIAGATAGHKVALLCGDTSDEEGRFEIRGWVPNWMGELQVVAAGYGRACVRVTPDEENEIALVRGFAVTARAVDAAGAPVPRAFVSVEATDRESTPRRISCGFAVSGDDGTFRVADLTRDLPHVLGATAPQGALVRRRIAAPGADGPETLDFGDVTLLASRAISGTVTRPDGGAASSVYVNLRGPFDDAGAELHRGDASLTDAGGRFRFDDLAPGRYVLTADAPGAAGVEVPVVVPADRDVENLRLPPDSTEAPIVVRVKDDAGTPLAGVAVWAWRRGSGDPVRATSDEGGVAQFASVADSPLHSLQVTAGDLTIPMIRIERGVSSYDVVVERAARVTCRLLDPDGRPIENAVLRVEPSRTGRMPFTDAEGRVTFAIPARGDVSVRFDGVISGRTEPALLEARADGVNAATGGEIVLRCRPVATGQALAVRVLAADGTAVAGIKVRLWNVTGFILDGATGDDGVARFTDLPAREFSVIVLPEVGRYGPRGLRAVAGGPECVARFPAVRELRGQVVWASGADAAEASVIAERGLQMFSLMTTDASGRFALEVPADDPGPFRLRVGALHGTTLVEEWLEGVTPGDTIRVVLRPKE